MKVKNVKMSIKSDLIQLTSTRAEQITMNIIEQIKNLGTQINQAIQNLFQKEELDKLARETGFIQRSTSKIQGSDLIELMTTEIVQEPNISYAGLCDRLRKINPEANISPQALEQRINSEGAVNYLEATLKRALPESLSSEKNQIKTPNEGSLLAPFPRIFLQDSTQCTLHEQLAQEFKGSGGSASKASVKMDFVYELNQNVIHELLVSAGAIPDQSRASSFINQLKPNDLVLRDLGYFKLKGLAQIVDKKAFYLSRLLPNIEVYLNLEDETPVNLPKYLNKVYSHESLIELTVYLGQTDKLKTRLVVYRSPQEVIKARTRQARRNATKKGRTPTQKYFEWLKFSFFVTNVPVEIWSAKVIGTIYRLRWQIELLFKNWKSLLQIHLLKGTRPERIKCLIYGRLISVVIITRFCGLASIIAQLQYQREVSFYKVTQWLLRSARLANAIANNLVSSLWDELTSDILRICKQKRKRKTTKELIEQEIEYMDSFDNFPLKPQAKSLP
jgi:nucleoside diphosphate kinase